MGTLHKQSAHKRIAWTAGLLAVTTLVLVGCTRAPSPNPTPTPILVSTSVPSPTATPGPAVSTPTPRPSVPGKGTDASPPAELPEYPGGASGFTQFVFEKIHDNFPADYSSDPTRLQKEVDRWNHLTGPTPLSDEEARHWFLYPKTYERLRHAVRT